MNNQKRVLIVHNVISPYRLPVFESVANAVDTTVWFCKSRTKDRLWSTSLEGFRFKRRRLAVFTLGPFFINPTILWHLLREDYDAYLVGDFPEALGATIVTMMIARWRRRPVILWSETTGDEVHYFQWLNPATTWHQAVILRILRLFASGYRRALFTFPDRFLALSGLAQEYLLGKGVAAVKITRGIQVMPVELLSAPQVAKSHSPYVDCKVILYVGYLNPRKAVDVLIKALTSLSDPTVRLIIAGAGSQETRLRALAAGDSRIVFAGYVDGVDKANLFNWADVFALPTMIDCWGLVINEALHYGVPVVVTAEAGGAELLTPATGRIVPALDVTALAGALQTLLDQPQPAGKHPLRRDITDAEVGARPIVEAIQAALVAT